MAEFPDADPLTQPCLDDLKAVADRYLHAGLDPAAILSALAAVAITTAQADPQYKHMYLDYFADLLRGAADVTITDE